MSHLLKSFFKNYPTVMEEVECSNSFCAIKTQFPITSLTCNTNEGLENLEKYLETRLMTQYFNCGQIQNNGEPCDGTKTIKPHISPIHLFIEIFKWDGEHKSL